MVRPSETFRGPGAEQRAKRWAAGEVEPAVWLLGHWFDHWMALREPVLDPSTVLIYRNDIAACAPLIRRPLAAITTADWQMLTNELLGRWSRYHVAVWRGNISTMLRAAIPEHLTENPLAKVRLPRPEEKPPKAWRQDEVDRLLAAAVGGLHEVWLNWMLGTGTRLGESRAVLWTDLAFSTLTATIHQAADNQNGAIGPTKTRRVRVIDFPEEIVPLLDAHRKRQSLSETYVFGHGGRPYNANAPRRWLYLLCKRAGVTVLPPHSCRHTYVSLALDAGVPVQDIAQQLGHTVATLQRVYANFIGQGQRRAATAIGQALRHRHSGPKQIIPRAATSPEES